MKKIARLVIPTLILAVLVLTTGGLAFAKEFGFLSRTGGEIELTGVVETINPDQITVSGTDINLLATTEMEQSVAVGDAVRVHAQRGADEQLVAREIELVNPVAGSDAVSASVSTTDESASGEIEIIGTVESIGGESWVISGQVYAITTATEIKGSLAIGDQVKVHAYTTSAGVLTAREIELYPDGDDAEDENGEFEFSGRISLIDGNTWTIGGRTVLVSSATEIKGTLTIGDLVQVHAYLNTDGSLTAREIEMFDGEDDMSDDSGWDDDASGSDDSGGDLGGHGRDD